MGGAVQAEVIQEEVIQEEVIQEGGTEAVVAVEGAEGVVTDSVTFTCMLLSIHQQQSGRHQFTVH